MTQAHLSGRDAESSQALKRSFLSIVLLLFLAASAAYGQTVWNGSTSNDWFTGSNWTPNVSPNSNSTDVVIGNATNNPVVLGATATVDNLTLSNSTNSLTVSSGALIVAGTSISNAGTINLNSALELANNVTLSGSGTMIMTGDASSQTGGQIGTNSNGYTLTNQSTIQGSGTIGSNNITWQNLSLNNQGTINANSGSNVLSITGTGGSITNTGTLEATAGILDLSTSAAIVDSGGQIVSTGSTSTVNVSTTIQGGTLTTSNGGILQTGAAGATLNAAGGITLSDGSTYTAASGTITKITGTLNLGTVTGSTLALPGALELIGDTTLSGPAGAVVNITGTASNQTGGQIGTNGNDYTLTNNVTIQGSGTIGSDDATYQNLSLLNNGTINANTSGQVLAITGTGGSIVNAGTFEATGGGILNLTTNAAIDNSTGQIVSNGSGSTVNLATTIQGGTLTTSNGGVLQTSASGATLDASSKGAITLTDGSTYTATAGTTFITGTLNLGTVTGSTLTLGGALELTGNTNLSGPAGAVVNISGTASNQTGGQIGTNGNDYTLTNNVTIQGSGTIGSDNTTYQNLSLLNNGTINANTSGQVLAITGNGASIVNAGTFEATGGGILNLTTSAAINNSTGQIISSGSGSTVNVSTTIEGGTLTTSNGGLMQTSGAATLDASTLGAITLTDGSTYTAAGGSVTKIIGQLNLGTSTGSVLALNGDTTTLVLTGNTTLNGPGSVNIMNGQIGTNGNGYTLTNQSTIHGYGLIGSNYGADYQNLSLNNTGIINADSNGNTLTIGGTGASITNTATFEATNGGILALTTSAPINNVGGTILASGTGSTVNVNTTIQGGTLTTSNGGVMQTATGGATLDASGAHPILISDGSTYTATNGNLTAITGNLNLGTSTGGTLALNGQLQLIGNTTFSGPGVVTMTGTPSTYDQGTGGQIGTNGNAYTLTNQSTIQGSGLIGSNVGALYQNLNLLNQGVVNANSAGNTLEIGGDGTITNTKTFEATAGGTLVLGNPTINNNGGAITATGAGSQVQISSSDIQGGTLTTSNGGTMVTLGSSRLDGASQGAITLSDGSTLTSGAGTFTQINGTLNLGTLTGSTYALQGDLQLVNNTTLSGPGTLLMSGAAQVGTNGNAYSLTNNATIMGTGLVGSNVGALYSNGSITNNGKLIANGGVLEIGETGGLTNYSANTLTGGTYIAEGVGGTLKLDPLGNNGGEIVNNDATIVLNGPTAQITDNANKDALSAFQDNLAGGSFTVENGQNFSTTPGSGADFKNEGSVLIADNLSSFTTTTNYTQDGANATTQVDGTLTAGGGSVNINAGTLLGSGTVVGNVMIGANGTLSPGDPGSPKAISITGNYSQAGTLDELIGGAAAGKFGQTLVSGSASIGGSTLDVSLVNGFTVGANTTDQFVIMTASSPIIGQFGTVDFLNAGLDQLTVNYSVPDEVILDISGPSSGGGGGTATPEPAEFLPLIGILAAVALWKIRRNRAVAE